MREGITGDNFINGRSCAILREFVTVFRVIGTHQVENRFSIGRRQFAKCNVDGHRTIMLVTNPTGRSLTLQRLKKSVDDILADINRVFRARECAALYVGYEFLERRNSRLLHLLAHGI